MLMENPLRCWLPLSGKVSERRIRYTIDLTEGEKNLINVAAGYARLTPDQFIVAAARYSIAKVKKNEQAILKLRAEEQELCGVKRID